MALEATGEDEIVLEGKRNWGVEDSRGGERPREMEMMLVKHSAKLSRRPMAGWSQAECLCWLEG